MKKRRLIFALSCLILIIIFSFGFISLISAEIIINEVELNPLGTDTGNEWIELYSNQNINIESWMIKSSNGRNMSFNASFVGYHFFYTPYLLLTNENNTLYIYDNLNNKVFSSPILSDSINDNKTWQYCNDEWKFRAETRDKENNCSVEIISENNNINNNSAAEESNQNSESIELSYDRDQENNLEFDVWVKVDNLNGNSYDVKIWIEAELDSETKVISDIYNIKEEKWQSGNYYIDNLFGDNDGKAEEDVVLRIKKEYLNYTGKVKIYARLRQGDKIIDVFSGNIELIREYNEEDIEQIEPLDIIQEELEVENIIMIGNTEKKDIDNRIIYKSKKEYINEYSLYLLGLFILGLLLVLVIKHKKIKGDRIEEYG